MDWGNAVVLIATLIGAVAAVIAILNGVYELREHRRERAISRTTSTQGTRGPGESSVPSEVSPPPQTRPATNVPTLPTPLIGRDDELAQVKDLLLRSDVRLLTLAGPAGIGKTRLALQVGTDLLGEMPDGVYFVALAPVTDPELVIPTIAQVLDVREQGSERLLDRLRGHLQDKKMLLVLDNLEQVVAAAPHLAALLAGAPQLKMLATSREVLRIYGEHSYEVPPLSLPEPDGKQGDDPAAILRAYEGVRLFVERAQAVDSGFSLTTENASAVVEICRRLDGLPLAIELAAARVRVLTPPALLERLVEGDGRISLNLLSSGARDLPARQQTLRHTIAWSYDLLEGAEQDLFRQLGVFSGGWTLEAAAAVWNSADGKPGLLEGLESLTGKSLVRRLEQDGEGRLMMLQTIREFALEQLEEAGMAHATCRRHAEWCLQFAEQAEPLLYTAQRATWQRRLQAEQENLRGALAWAVDNQDAELGIRLAGSLAWLWNLQGRVSEGRRWLEAALAVQGSAPPGARAKALLGLGELVSNQADWTTAWAAIEESIELARSANDRRLLALGSAILSLFRVRGARGEPLDTDGLAEESIKVARELADPWVLGYVLTVMDIRSVLLGDPQPGPVYGDEALRCFEASGDLWGTVLTLRHLGLSATARGDFAAARSASEKALAASRRMGYRLGEAYTLNSLADIARVQGDYVSASDYYAQCFALCHDLGLRADVPAILHNMGHVALATGDTARAESLHMESLRLHKQAGNRAGMAEALIGVAAVARAGGDLQRAARLLASADAARTAIGAPLWPAERIEYDRQVEALHREMDDPVLAAAWAEGGDMSLEQAVAVALSEDPALVSAGQERSVVK